MYIYIILYICIYRPNVGGVQEYRTQWNIDQKVAQSDIKQNIAAGRGRVVTQRRSGRTVHESKKIGAKMEVPGTWYTPEKYPFGDPKENKHMVRTQLCPVTKKLKKVIFVPDDNDGSYKGSLYSDTGVTDTNTIED
jgi:hypothetical protein